MMGGYGILMTSMFEGFPLSLVESLSFGLPIISYDCPNGPAEIIDDGVNGYLIPVGDKQSFANKIIELTHNEQLWNTLHQGALESAQKYSMKTIMSQWDSLFNRLYEERKTSR